MIEKKQVLTTRQMGGWMLMFFISETIVGMCEPLIGNGTWITFLIAGAFTFFMFFVYTYIMSQFPEKDIFDIFKITLGSFLSKILGILFIFFAIYVASIALKNIVVFSKLQTLEKTPIFIIGLIIVIWAAYTIGAEGGIEASGRTVLIVTPIVVFIYLFFAILLIPIMDFDNLLPIVTEPIGNIMKTSYMAYSNTSGDIVLFMGFLLNPIKKNNRFKVFSIVNTIGIILLVINSILITSLLGIHIYADNRFPAYNAFSLFYIGNFISRVELVVSLTLLLCIVSKVAAGIYVASRGCSKVFKTSNFRKWVYLISAIVLFLATFDKDTSRYLHINHQILWAKNIFQVGIPIILAIIVLIKKPKLISYGLIEQG